MTSNENSGRWPTQDDVDRSDAIAIVASLSPVGDFRPSYPELQSWHERSDEVRGRFEKAVNEAVVELEVSSATGRLIPQRYQIGPASEGLITSFIITLWDHREDFAMASSAVDIAEFSYRLVRAVKGRLHAWDRSLDDPPAEVELTLPPEMLVDLCERHVRVNYHPRARLSREWTPLTQEFYAGYRSPAHPTSDMEYLVTISTRSNSYTFRVMGNGRVVSHHMKQGSRIVSIPMPELVSTSADLEPKQGHFHGPD